MAILDTTDLPAVVRKSVDPETLQVMVAGLDATAQRVAPCLAEQPTDGQRNEARLILVGTVQRWADAGSGALTQQAAGPFSQTLDTRQRPGWKLWPSDIEQLQEVCTGGDVETRTAYSIDTIPTYRNPHLRTCPAHDTDAGRCTCAGAWVC